MGTTVLINLISNPTKAMNYCRLPENLVPRILLRLPVKSLARFKSVCKTWNNIIKNPSFAKSHYTQQHSSINNPPLPSLLVIRSDNNIFSLDINTSLNQSLGDTAGHAKCKFIRLSHPSLRGGFRPLGSCHGIICMYVYGEQKIFLWNPHTKECRYVGHPCVNKGANLQVQGSGFGFVPSINDYKIVLVNEAGGQPSQVFVYSLRANSWREIEINNMGVRVFQLRIGSCYDTPWKANADNVQSVQVKEALYWIGRYNNPERYVVLKFDLINDVFDVENTISTREGKGNKPVSIGIIGDDKVCVCLSTDDYKKPSTVETCVMENTYGKYNKAERKSVLKIKGDWRYIGSDHRVLGVACNGKVMIMEKKRTDMDYMLIVDGRQQPPSYIQLTNEYTPPHQRGIGIKCVMSYFPSLVSPFYL